MDLLFKRYSASPFPFLNGMIQTGRFAEFVDEIIKITNAETEEETMWEFYLHRVFSQSFAQFMEAVKVDRENRNMSEFEIETTIQNSLNILGNFNPEKEGVEQK